MQSVGDIDKEVLGQFLTDGVYQRGMVLERMLTNLYIKHPPGHFIDVEFYRNYIMSLDDLINWYHVLKEWQPNWKPVHMILQDVQTRKRNNGSDLFAAYTFEEVSRMDRARLYERLNLPGDSRLAELGWDEGSISRYKVDIKIVLDRFCQSIKERVLYGGVRSDIITAFKNSGILEDYSASDESFHEVQLTGPSSGLEVVGIRPAKSYTFKVDKRTPNELFSQIKVNAATLAFLLMAFYDGQYGEEPIIPPVLGATKM